MPQYVFRILQLTILLTPLIIYTGTKDNFLIKETAAGILVLFAMVSFVVHKIEHNKKFLFGKLTPFMALYFCSIILSSVYSKHLWLVFKTFYIHLLFAGIYLLSCEMSDAQRNKIINTIFAVSIITSIYGIFQHFGYDFFSWVSGYGGRPLSSFGNPNFYAGYLVLVFPLILSKSIFTQGSMKFLWISACFLSVINLYLNRTRGAWIAAAVSVVYLYILLVIYRKQFKLLLIGLVLVLCITALFKSRIMEFTNNYFNSKDPSVIERIFKWRTALEMVKKYPVTGVGAGNLKVNYALYQAKVRDKAGFKLRGTSESNVHNEYLQIWAEAGTLGLLSFLSIFVFYFVSSKNLDYVKIGLSAGILGFLVYCLSNFPLRIIPTAATAFLFLGMSGNQLTVDGRQLTAKNKGPKWVLRIAAGLMYLVIVYKMAILPFTADIHRRNGDVTVQHNNDLTKAAREYERSIALDYFNSERTAYDLGEVYRKMGDIDRALKAYGISVDLRNYGEVYNCIGNCYWMKKDVKNAIKNWETAIELGLPDIKDQQTVKNNLKIAYSMSR
jgi:O-antigen ligase